MKKNVTKAKVAQTIIFLVLSFISFCLIIAIWSFLYEKGFGENGSRSARKGILLICLVPMGLLYMALSPWIKFNGVKGDITGGQLMSLNEDGYYLGAISYFGVEPARKIAHIFNREASYQYGPFHYSEYAIYLKHKTGGHWFFPDKIDKCLIMTGEPGSVIGMGFRISEEEWSEIEQLIIPYDLE